MRGWDNDVPNYSPPVPVGDVMRAFAAGEVVASRHSGWKVGDLVTDMRQPAMRQDQHRRLDTQHKTGRPSAIDKCPLHYWCCWFTTACNPNPLGAVQAAASARDAHRAQKSLYQRDRIARIRKSWRDGICTVGHSGDAPWFDIERMRQGLHQ
jgi:hypothetical protein